MAPRPEAYTAPVSPLIPVAPARAPRRARFAGWWGWHSVVVPLLVAGAAREVLHDGAAALVVFGVWGLMWALRAVSE